MKATPSKYQLNVDYEFNGNWDFQNFKLPQYTEFLYHGSFTVDESKGQTIESELEETRNRFKEAKR